MLFEFIGTAYSCTILFLIIVYLFTKGRIKYLFKNFIAVSNTLLILYSTYLMYQFYQLVRYIYDLNIQLPKNASEKPIDISWFQIKFVLLIFLPFLFLSKQLKSNIILAGIMLVLLQWDVAADMYQSIFKQSQTAGVIFYFPYLLFYKILNYLALFISVYALLWLAKKLPYQSLK